jgi:tetratricopeptide (TPR) repeat protein
MLESRPHITSTDDMTTAFSDVTYLESAVLVGNRQAVELLLRRFAHTALPLVYIFCVARILGGAAAFLERYDEAREHYQEAIRVCTKIKHRPELALSRLQFAELLLDHFPKEKAEAIKHLDFAIKEFREMKMQPSLERALRRKDILKA